MTRWVIVGSIVAFVAAAAAVVTLVTIVRPNGESHAATAPRTDPAAFVTRIVGFVVRDEYGRAWDDLYPAHQKVASRQEYVDCEQQTPVGGVVRSIEVLDVADEQARIPGESRRVAAKAVKLRVTLVEPATHARDVFTHTFHAVLVGARWTWILSPPRYALYRSGSCGS